MEHGDLEIADRENIISSRNPTRKDLHQLDSQNNEALEFTKCRDQPFQTIHIRVTEVLVKNTDSHDVPHEHSNSGRL